jgi:uncharacterized protein DUF4136
MRVNVLAGAALLALCACASGPEIRVDFDRSASFEKFRSFAFQSPLGTDRDGYEGSVSRYLKAAARRELEARGLRYDESAPDVRVNFSAQLAEKVQVINTPHPAPGGYYAYRFGYYTTWSGYPATQVVPYTEGTLNVDVIDVARRQLVWEGVVIGVVSGKTLADPQPAIDSAIKEVFSRYPR